MLRFLRLIAQNFGTFKDLQLDLAELGLVCVLGQNLDAPLADSNGSGKSLLLEALVWCLWGKTIRGLKADEVVNEVIGKDCFVQLDIEENGHLYSIRRTRLMSGEKPNNLFFYINGQESSNKDMDSVQEQIDTLIGQTFDTFCAMMPGAKIKVAEYTDAKIKELLESLLHTESFATAYKIARDKHKVLTQELDSLSKELPKLNLELEALDAQLDEHVRLDREYSLSLAEKREYWSKKRKELTAVMREYASIVDGRDDLDKKRAQYLADEAEMKQLVAGRSVDVMVFRDTANKTLTEAYRNIAVVVSKLKDTNTKLEQIAHMEANCTHCHQTVPEEHKELVKKQLLNDQRQFGAQQRRLEALVEGFNASTSAKEAEMQQAVVEAEERLREAQGARRDVERTLREGIAEAKKHLATTKNSLAEVETLLTELNMDVSPWDKLIDNAKAQQVALLSRRTKQTARLKQVEKDAEYVGFWADSFSPQGLRSHLLENVTPYLNERVKLYADLLTDGELCITFHTQSKLANGNVKEKFFIDVQQSHGSGKYKGSSDGEKRRADICIAFALGDLAALRAKKELPFRFLDEPFENLDESGIQAVVKLLAQQAEQFETVIVITHNDQLKAVFPKEIVVQKSMGLSRIVTDDHS